MNMLAIDGVCGRDAEIAKTANGKTVCEISLGHRIVLAGHPKTIWISVQVFGEKLAAAAFDNCKKGRWIVASGSLDIHEWTDKATGEKRSRVKLIGTVQWDWRNRDHGKPDGSD